MVKKLKRVEIAQLAAFHRLASNGLLRLKNSVYNFAFLWVVDSGGIQEVEMGRPRMSRKRSIPDSVRAGRSRIVPYYRGEDFRMRHARRLSANLEQEANVRRWCGQRGLKLRITNEGHHWQITDGGFLAEWWPSSAKLVIGKKWHDGIHCHDYKQALKVIEDFHRKKRL